MDPHPNPEEGGSAGTAPEPAPAPSAPRARRPYEPPRILHREPLEVMAAVCAPSPPAKSNPGFCIQGPISS
jgi:hypothetical protein